ncbi:hypothetical protein [Aurantibacter sp.]|uniref:hypothetical protein n=1 Tax=Aurantibacter sp. TaxID=2807103 RepID=UPI003264BA55
MAGGGIAAAIVALKNNRSLLSKRKLKSKGDVYGIESKTKLNLKVSTEQDMKRIRKKIKTYKRQERLNWTIAICITFFFFYAIIWWMAT